MHVEQLFVQNFVSFGSFCSGEVQTWASGHISQESKCCEERKARTGTEGWGVGGAAGQG